MVINKHAKFCRIPPKNVGVERKYVGKWLIFGFALFIIIIIISF